MSIVAGKSTCTYLWLFVLLRLGWGREIFSNSQVDGVNLSRRGSPFQPYTRISRASETAIRQFCSAPPQPDNGEWKLQRDFCEDDTADCKVAEGTDLALGWRLIYNCTGDHKIVGDNIAFCRRNGKWSSIPVCRDIGCEPLNTIARVANCSRFNESVDCDRPALPDTRAEVSCRFGYREDITPSTQQKHVAYCNEDGKWQPEPIECSEVCGQAYLRRRPFVISGSNVITDISSHANLYAETQSSTGTEKELICSATIIRANLLLTALKCVYATNGTMVDPKNLFVMTGNTYRDYDHRMHDLDIVKKRSVKKVHLNPVVRGSRIRLPSEIALLELEKPFMYSATLLPACWDTSSSSAPILESGSKGKIVGFELTDTGEKSSILQTTTVHYIPSHECAIPEYTLTLDRDLVADSICTKKKEGGTICTIINGSGLMFQRNDAWYVMGVANVPRFVSPDSNTCDSYTYKLYISVAHYVEWIRMVISQLEPKKTTSNVTPSRGGTSGIASTLSACFAPPWPSIGSWTVHQSLCPDGVGCYVNQGIQLAAGTLLIYSCPRGYVVKGSTEVYCGFNGDWSAIPLCTEIKCKSLSSVSRRQLCHHQVGEWTSCDSSVPPGTWVKLSCHQGYTPDTSVPTYRGEHVKCNESGEWTPDPIICVPVCGVAVSHQIPFISNGIPAKLSDFPWHATLYMQTISSQETTKKFRCGATIIHINFLLTAAHCVYDDTTETTIHPGKLFVMTGNIFRDYDSPFHNQLSVRRGPVKNVHRPCEYYGLRGNYVSDIALLEIQTPFNLSSLLLPACLNTGGNSEQILEPGVEGRVAGFGRTTTGESSGILQTLTLPYISYNECNTMSLKNNEKNDVFISKDKFCAGYTNGSAVCEGDSGGGLVFQKHGLWYVMGIVSVGLGVDIDNGERTCDKYSYSLYTKVSEHMTWIQDVMFERAQGNSYLPCNAA